MKMGLVWLLVLALGLSLTACRGERDASSAPEEPESFVPVGSVQEYFTSEYYVDETVGVGVHYLLHEPIRASAREDLDAPVPLVIFLHGLGDTVDETNLGTAGPFVESMMALENRSAEYGTYTLVPKTPLAHEGWWTAEMLTAFKELIYYVIGIGNVDPKRVYLSGISMGGFVTCQLVNEMPADTFAAAVPLSGASRLNDPRAVYNTAFRIYHVATDTVVNVSTSRSLNEQLFMYKHPNFAYFESETGNHLSPLYTVFYDQRDEFFGWLFDQRLP